MERIKAPAYVFPAKLFKFMRFGPPEREKQAALIHERPHPPPPPPPMNKAIPANAFHLRTDQLDRQMESDLIDYKKSLEQQK